MRPLKSGAACHLTASYLSSQSPFLDLGDVGVRGLQRVKIHFVELVVELFAKLPGQVVVAERAGNNHREQIGREGFITRLWCSVCAHHSISCGSRSYFDQTPKTLIRVIYTLIGYLHPSWKDETAVGLLPAGFRCMLCTHPSMRGVVAISCNALVMFPSSASVME